MDAIYSIGELRKTLQPVFEQYGVKSAILFGSYAKGNASTRSDVDLLVDSGLRGMAFFGLLESVVSTLSVPVDMIDVTQVEKNSEIDREIQRTGVRIFGQ